MAQYKRTSNVLKSADETITCDSINKAKKIQAILIKTGISFKLS